MPVTKEDILLNLPCDDDGIRYYTDKEINSAMDKWAAIQTAERDARIKELEDGLRYIIEDEGEHCVRCGGEGNLWADGKSHYSTYNGPTVNCGKCGGKGRIYSNIKEIATQLLNTRKG